MMMDFGVETPRLKAAAEGRRRGWEGGAGAQLGRRRRSWEGGAWRGEGLEVGDHVLEGAGVGVAGAGGGVGGGVAEGHKEDGMDVGWEGQDVSDLHRVEVADGAGAEAEVGGF